MDIQKETALDKEKTQANFFSYYYC